MSKKILTVDVREDIKRGREPLSKILQSAGALKDNETLRVVAPFRPAPLLTLLANRGFSHEAHQTVQGDWEVLFTRGQQKEVLPKQKSEPEKPGKPKGTGEKCSCGCGRTLVELDVRGLEPPQPLVKVLETLADLPQGSELKVFTNRRPLHLYAHLDERGFIGRTEETTDGSFVTYIHTAK